MYCICIQLVTFILLTSTRNCYVAIMFLRFHLKCSSVFITARLLHQFPGTLVHYCTFMTLRLIRSGEPTRSLTFGATSKYLVGFL